MQLKISQVIHSSKFYLDSSRILLAMLLAGFLGRYAAEVFTGQISDEWTKFVVGIVIGMMVGLATGVVVQRAWGQLMRFGK